MGDSDMTYEEAVKKCRDAGQEHVLKYYEELTKEEKEALLTQIGETDFTVTAMIKDKEAATRKGKIEPLTCLQLAQIEQEKEQFLKTGTQAIREGKVGAVLLAGGMGTRLGSEDPKGMYNIGLTKDVFIFQRLIENLMDVVRQTDTWIPLYVMTSDKNHEATTAFFEEKEYFGYCRDQVFFFRQEMAPASDYEGKVYLEAKNKISTSPNGNGGWFSSMAKWGILDKVHEAGVEWLMYLLWTMCCRGSRTPALWERFWKRTVR